MATSLSQRVISSKIGILVEQRDHLQSLVHEADEMLQLATSWLRNTDETKNITFQDISKMIEDKLMFLSGTDFSVGCEKIVVQQESASSKSIPLVTSSPDLPLPARHDQVSATSVLPDELTTIMSQVKVMQEAISFLSTSTEKISEKQLIMEQSIESLPDQYTEVEQEKFTDIETKFKNIYEKLKKAAAKQGKRFKSFESKIKTVTDAQSQITDKLQLQMTTMEEQKKENEKLQKQSQQFTQDLNVVLENIQVFNSRICLMESKTLIDTKQEALENKVKLVESLSEKLEEFTIRTDETLSNLSSAQKSKYERLQQFEKKIGALENNWMDDSQEIGKLYSEVENKYQMVCQVVADRLAPLEKLRGIFNEKLDVRNASLKKLNQVCYQMSALMPKLSQLETDKQRQAIGFSAFTEFLPVKDKVIKNFTVVSNNGNHFNPTTGMFTAPLDGLYATSLCVKSAGDGNLLLVVVKRPCALPRHSAQCDKCKVIRVFIVKGDKQASVFVIVDLKAAETLNVTCEITDEMFHNTMFTCFRIC